MTLTEKLKQSIDDHKQDIAQLEALTAVVAELGIASDERAVVYQRGIDWDSCDRAQFDQIRRLFPPGLRWQRSVCGANPEHLDYETQYKGFRFRCWNAEPPASCKVIWEEVVIPKHVARKPKIVCGEKIEVVGEQSAELTLAQEGPL